MREKSEKLEIEDVLDIITFCFEDTHHQTLKEKVLKLVNNNLVAQEFYANLVEIKRKTTFPKDYLFKLLFHKYL